MRKANTPAMNVFYSPLTGPALGDGILDVLSSFPKIIKLRNRATSFSHEVCCEACGNAVKSNKGTELRATDGEVFHLGPKCSKTLRAVFELK